MNGTKLTIQKLKAMKPGVFATGTGTYPEIIDIEIRWVAVRGGGYHDWTIYYLSSSQPVGVVVTNGDKMFTESIIRRLVPCEAEAFGMYRL